MCFSAWSFVFKLLFSLLLICIFKGFIFSLIKSTAKTTKTFKMRLGYTAEMKCLSNTGFYLHFFVKWGLLLYFYLLTRNQISWTKSWLKHLKIQINSATCRRIFQGALYRLCKIWVSRKAAVNFLFHLIWKTVVVTFCKYTFVSNVIVLRSSSK